MARPTKPEGTTAARIVAFRLTPADEALLAGIVAEHEKRLAEQGIIASVRTTDIVRTLIRREADALGIAPTKLVGTHTPAVDTAPASFETKPKPAKKPPAKGRLDDVAPTQESVRAAVAEAIKGGVRQAEIRREAAIDQGQFSRFLAGKGRLSPAKLSDVDRVLARSGK